MTILSVLSYKSNQKSLSGWGLRPQTPACFHLLHSFIGNPLQKILAMLLSVTKDWMHI